MVFGHGRRAPFSGGIRWRRPLTVSVLERRAGRAFGVDLNPLNSNRSRLANRCRVSDGPGRVLTLMGVLLSLWLWACAPPVVAPPPEPVPVPTKTPESVFFEAATLFQKGAYAEAAALYETFVTRFPASPRVPAAWMQLGAARRFLGDADGARQAYETVAENHSDSPLAVEARLALLVDDYENGRFEDLLSRVQGLLPLPLGDDRRRLVLTLAGDAAMALDQPMTAAEDYADAWVAADPKGRPAVYEKLVAALRLVETDRLSGLLARIGDPDLHARVSDLAGELTFDRHTVACLLPLTGPYATIGQRALRGAEMALNRFSETTGDEITTVRIWDTAADSDRARAAAQQGAAQGAAAILGPIATADVAAAQAQGLQIPILTLTQKDGIPDMGDFVFRNFITPAMQVDALVDYATDAMGLNRFAILYPDEPYGTTFMNLFWDRVIAAGGEVVGVESYGRDQNDFAASIEKLVGLYYEVPEDLREQPVVVKPMTDDALVDFDALFHGPLRAPGSRFRSLPEILPPPPGFDLDTDADSAPRPHREEDKPDPIIDFDALFIPDGPKKAGLIVPQLAYNDVTGIQLLGTNLWHSPTLMDMSREYLQGALFPDGFFSESDLPEVREFVARFHDVYGEAPGVIEAVTYDNMMILLELLAHPAVRSRAGLRDALTQLAHYPGVTGQTAFGPDGEARKNLFLLRVKGRRLMAVTPFGRPNAGEAMADEAEKKATGWQ